MNKKKGISLIVLTITIIVMAILATTAIISLEDTGIISHSKQTVRKENYINEYERLAVIKDIIIADNFGEITAEEYMEALQEKGMLKSEITTNDDGSKSATTTSGLVVNVIQDGETDLIISLGTNDATIALSTSSIEADVTGGPVTKSITASVTNVIGDIIWTTSNPRVATVTGTNSSAKVTLKGIGNATITAIYGNVKATCSVKVTGTVAEPTITLDKTTISKTINTGTTATETITATIQNITGNLTWTSSNTNVATVSGSGNTATITMKAGGTAVITATSGSTSASCTVVVTENEVERAYYISGVWEINKTIDIEFSREEPLEQDVKFVSYGKNYLAMTFIVGCIDYFTEDDNEIVFDSTYVDYPNGGWSNEQYRTVDFGETPQQVSKEFYNWLTANAVKGNVLPAYYVSGIWTFKQVINFEVDLLEQVVNFTSNGKSYTNILSVTGTIDYGYDGGSDYVYDSTIYPDGVVGWMSEEYRIVDFGETPQEVSKEFYEELTANAEKEKYVIKYIYTDTKVWEIAASQNMTWQEIVDQGMRGMTFSGPASFALLLSIEDGKIKHNGTSTDTVSGTLVSPTDKFGDYTEYRLNSTNKYLYGIK